MNLMILAGVWALAFGHITITQSMKMKGNESRLFGLVLIGVAAYGLPHLNEFFFRFMPSFVAGNDAFKSAYELLIGAFAIYATGWVMTELHPRLKFPRLVTSHKRRRAA